MNKDEFNGLIEKLHKGESEQHEEAIKYLMPLARAIARKYPRYYDEYKSIGYLVIVECVNKIRTLDNVDNFRGYVGKAILRQLYRHHKKNPSHLNLHDYPYEDTNIGFELEMEFLLKKIIKDELRIEIAKSMMDGYKQKEIAEQLHISPSYISKIKERYWN